MTLRQKRAIYQECRALAEARARLGTIGEIARQYGLTRQRIHQIVREVEESYGRQVAAAKKGERNETKENDKKAIEEVQAEQGPAAPGAADRACQDRV